MKSEHVHRHGQQHTVRVTSTQEAIIYYAGRFALFATLYTLYFILIPYGYSTVTVVAKNKKIYYVTV